MIFSTIGESGIIIHNSGKEHVRIVNIVRWRRSRQAHCRSGAYVMKSRMRMAPILLLGAVTIAGILWCDKEVNAADARKGSAPNSTPATGSRSARAWSISRETSQAKGQASREPAIQGTRVGALNNESNAGQLLAIAVSPDDRISADIKERPLAETLRAMADKKLFDIKGPLPTGEEITAQFSDLTLDQAIKKLMRGYNYVLMEQGVSQKPVLILIGKVQRGAYGEQPSSATQVVPSAVNANQPREAAYTPATAITSLPRAGNRRIQITALRNNRTAAAPAAIPSEGPGALSGTEANKQPLASAIVVEAPSKPEDPTAGQVQPPVQPGQSQAQPPTQSRPVQDEGNGGSSGF